MLAYRMHAVGIASLDEVEVPTPGPGEALIAPLLSGICSTDIHVIRQGALTGVLPITMGHEVVGRVVELGRAIPATEPYRGVPLARVGDLVTVEPLLPCGRCSLCFRGLPNLCEQFDHLGITRDGCFAEFVRVPLSRVFPLGGLAPEEGIFVEPLACALHFIDRAGVQPGMCVMVLGAGPAGLMTVEAAAAAGARVLVSEPDSDRRSLALSLGAQVALNPLSNGFDEALLEATRGAGPDAVIEVTGVPGAISTALQVAPRGGRVVLAGICGGQSTPIDTDAVVTRELTIIGAVASRWQFARAAALIRQGHIQTRPLITHRRPWEHVGAMIDLAAGIRGVVKVLLEH